jgi:response regulator RpfG family c-di-GMP phosphodiesterase
MTSNRPYRKALSREESLAIIRTETGKQFDPGIVTTFLEMKESEIQPERKTILIVDDDESIRLLVRSVMGNDYAVIEAASGQEAINSVRASKPALVLMDILMSDKDGLQACCEIKSDPKINDIPIVILTAVDFALNRKLSADLGAAGYITKPFTPQKLLATVNELINNPSRRWIDLS